MPTVVKSDGKKEVFRPDKIINTCMRSGADRNTAEDIARYIQSAAKSNTTTHDIYRMILDELERREDRSSILFRLREAISLLDSEPFELYVKRLLETNGYRCLWNRKIRGQYAEHQIDVIARKDKEVFLVECKRHINPHRYTGLNICLQVQARLEDIHDNSENGYSSAKPWIIVNGKFSEHAKTYAHGKNIRLTGWRYGSPALEEMIHSKSAFPVTILTKDRSQVAEIMKNDVLTVNDFLQSPISKKKNLKALADQARLLKL